MKYKILLLSLVVYTNSFFSQNPTVDIDENCVGGPASTFTPPNGYTTFYWDFQDGVTSLLENPFHSFTAPGTYIVEFSDLPGNPVIGTVTVIIYEKPIPSFTTTTPTVGCVPLTVTFEDNTTLPGGVTISGYNWTFGDGGSGNTSPVSYTYTLPNTYNVSLDIITNIAACNASVNINDFITATEPPIAQFFANPTSACTPGTPVIFTNNSTSPTTLTYFWDFGNGNTSTDQFPPNETYSVDGNFQVMLTVTDANGCIQKDSTIISIGEPTSSFVIPDTVCINVEVTPTNNSSTGSSLWDFGANGTLAIGSSQFDFEPTVLFTSSGLQTITLTTTAGGCPDDTTRTIFVEDPQIDFTSTPSYFCYEPATINYTANSTSTIVSWDWTFGDDSTGTGETISHEYVIGDTVYSEHGEQIIGTTLTIITSAGCTATFTDTDTIHLPWARFMPDVVNGCAPLTVTFSDSSLSNTPTEPIVSWEYDYGDGNSATFLNDNPNSYVFTTPGEYDVVLIITNSSGCTDTSDTIRIEVGDLVALDFAADVTSICAGDTVNFNNLTADVTNIDAWHYSSESDRLSHCYQNDTPYWVFGNETGLQDVTLTAEYNGCFSTLTKPNYIDVSGPLAKFNYSQSCDTLTIMNVLFSDSSSDATSILWDFGDGNTSTASTVPYTYAATGDYNVVITASNAGCPDSKDSAIVHIRKINADFLTDTLLCLGVSYDYDASLSTDVNEYCNRGYTWIFSDPPLRPLTGSSPDEPITFVTSGDQTIGLVVEDINGCVDTLIQDVRVFNSTANFSVSDSTICYPVTLDFNDLTFSDTLLSTWSWSFGDNNQNPSGIDFITGPSPLSVTLTTRDTLGCTSNYTYNIAVYKPASFIGVIPSPANVCTDEMVDFISTDYTSQGSFLDFSWDFGDGNTSVQQNDSNSYAVGGIYDVMLTYTENATGCTDSVSTIVNVQDYPIPGFFSDVDALPAVCPGQAISFTDTSSIASGSIFSYFWDFGDGSFSFLKDPQYSFDPTASGTFNIELTVSTTFGCKDSIIKQITVIAPYAEASIDKNNICKGESITFTLDNGVDIDSLSWDFGDGVLSNISPVTHQYNFLPPSGQTTASLFYYGINKNCFTPPITIPIFIYEVRAEFDRVGYPDTIFCLGEELTLINQSSPLADMYSWTLGDGGTSTSATSFPHTYAVADTFDITLSVESSTLGCTDEITKQVIVVEGPSLAPVGATICPNTSAIVQSGLSGAAALSWQPSSDVISPSGNSTSTISLFTSQWFYISALDINGCTAYDSAYVYVFPQITGYTFDTLIVVGDSIFLPIDNASGAINFIWTPEDGLSCLDCSNPWTESLLDDITYSLYAEDIYGCGSATFEFNIEVIPETLLEVPTTFTPNGDGINDIIYLESWGVKELYEFQIYNRWGELIFETDDINVGWNGYYNGVLQNNDIYVFKARALDFFDEEMYKEGHIHLMR